VHGPQEPRHRPDGSQGSSQVAMPIKDAIDARLLLSYVRTIFINLCLSMLFLKLCGSTLISEGVANSVFLAAIVCGVIGVVGLVLEVLGAVWVTARVFKENDG
jgi:hypothetical protein